MINFHPSNPHPPRKTKKKRPQATRPRSLDLTRCCFFFSVTELRLTSTLMPTLTSKLTSTLSFGFLLFHLPPFCRRFDLFLMWIFVIFMPNRDLCNCCGRALSPPRRFSFVACPLCHCLHVSPSHRRFLFVCLPHRQPAAGTRRQNGQRSEHLNVRTSGQ